MKPLLVGALLLMAATSTATAQSCRQTLGPQRSEVLVRRCIQVSQATHPPCNAANPCDMIVDEIKHGCAELAEPGLAVKPPAFCRRYR
jgi:hypothetical protein